MGLKSPFWAGRQIWLKFKGSWKDPFLYLGALPLVLFITLAFAYFPSEQETVFNLVTSPAISEEFRNSRSFIVSKEAVKESPELYLVQKNTLSPISPPITVTPQVLGALAGGTDFDESAKKEITEYIIESGDSLWSIAKKFSISLDTLLWANDLNPNSYIQPGQKLIILPVSGVIYHVKKGDTLSGIAKTYKGDLEEIVVFNDLVSEEDISIGDILIIPNGVMPQKSVPIQYAPLASNYFICPIGTPCRLTQGLHWYNAVDLSRGKCGEPIFAAAAGTVLKVKLTSSTSKWAFSGQGNNLSILHPNGVVTSYGHIKTSLVNPGDQVSQGQIIATMGGQPGTPGAGKSTGCHVHFGVRGAKNPFVK